MNLLQITRAQALAAEINSINSETLSFIRSQLQRVWDLANTPEQQQAVMDVFGTNAVTALTVYATIHGTLTELGASGEVPEPAFDIFTPNEDGTVLFVPPPEPDIGEYRVRMISGEHSQVMDVPRTDQVNLDLKTGDTVTVTNS